jgi:hypothetical protein
VLAGGRSMDLSTTSGPDGGFSELLYLKDLTDPWYAVLDPQKQIGFGLAWNQDVFQYLWCWMVYGCAPGYPWWNRAYCLALEPWTSIPNTFGKALVRDNLLTLKGGGQAEAQLSATVITGRDSVKHVDITGNVT